MKTEGNHSNPNFKTQSLAGKWDVLIGDILQIDFVRGAPQFWKPGNVANLAFEGCPGSVLCTDAMSFTSGRRQFIKKGLFPAWGDYIIIDDILSYVYWNTGIIKESILPPRV
ncbi:MAG: hypothetical protein ABI855_19655, partial [Bacteroidota bacterium]